MVQKGWSLAIVLAAVTACSSKNTEPTTAAGKDATASGDTATGSDTSKTGDTAAGSDTSSSCGGADAMPSDTTQTSDPCSPCLKAKCSNEFTACGADGTCATKMQGVGDCLSAACGNAAGQQKCVDDFAASSTAAKAMATCVQANCKSECIH